VTRRNLLNLHEINRGIGHFSFCLKSFFNSLLEMALSANHFLGLKESKKVIGFHAEKAINKDIFIGKEVECGARRVSTCHHG
jgi:hypothetical protein